MDPGVGCAWAGMTNLLLLLLLGWYEREGMWARCLHRLWYSPLPPTGYMEYAKVSGEREQTIMIKMQLHKYIPKTRVSL